MSPPIPASFPFPPFPFPSFPFPSFPFPFFPFPSFPFPSFPFLPFPPPMRLERSLPPRRPANPEASPPPSKGNKLRRVFRSCLSSTLIRLRFFPFPCFPKRPSFPKMPCFPIIPSFPCFPKRPCFPLPPPDKRLIRAAVPAPAAPAVKRLVKLGPSCPRLICLSSSSSLVRAKLPKHSRKLKQITPVFMVYCSAVSKGEVSIL